MRKSEAVWLFYAQSSWGVSVNTGEMGVVDLVRHGHGGNFGVWNFGYSKSAGGSPLVPMSELGLIKTALDENSIVDFFNCWQNFLGKKGFGCSVIRRVDSRVANSAPRF